MKKGIKSRSTGLSPERIREYRTAVGLSQEGLARSLGISTALVVKWERGERTPNGPARILLMLAIEGSAPDLYAAIQSSDIRGK